MEITKVKSTSIFVLVDVEYLGERLDVAWTTEEGWELDQTIDHYGWEEWQIDECFELLQELPTPRVVLK